MKSQSRQLAIRGMQAALRLRQQIGADLFSPICIYDTCDRLGLQVRFAEINSMEGMYFRGSPAKIVIGARRPLPRRNFTCGHELGHHVFGHGSTVDELQGATADSVWQPEEFLANSFAANLLMPYVGLKRAFAVRGISAETAPPRAIFDIACNFGVGYDTLLNHLAHGTQLISSDRAEELSRSSPKEIRKSLLGRPVQEPLVTMDQNWTAPTVDIEVGTLLAVPTFTRFDGSHLRHYESLSSAELYQAVQPGIGRLIDTTSRESRFVRVSRFQFAGLSRFRHLEEVSGDEF